MYLGALNLRKVQAKLYMYNSIIPILYPQISFLCESVCLLTHRERARETTEEERRGEDGTLP